MRLITEASEWVTQILQILFPGIPSELGSFLNVVNLQIAYGKILGQNDNEIPS